MALFQPHPTCRRESIIPRGPWQASAASVAGLRPTLLRENHCDQYIKFRRHILHLSLAFWDIAWRYYGVIQGEAGPAGI